MVDVASIQYLPEADDYPAKIPRLEDGWWPTGGAVDPGNDNGLMNWQAQELAKRTNWLRARHLETQRTTSLTVTVGQGGDYPTINAAMAYLSMQRPRLQSGEVKATIRLLSNFVMAEAVIVRGLNLGWVEIVADAATVTIQRSALVTPLGSSYPAWGGDVGAVLPRLATKFVMDNSGAAAGRIGVGLVSGSQCSVAPSCGVINAGETGAVVQASWLFARSGVFSGAGTRGILAGRGASVEFYEGNVSGCGSYGLWVERGAFVDATLCDATACGINGVSASGLARVDFLSGKARKTVSVDAATDIAVAQGGQINALNATGGTSVAKNTITASGVIYG